ncbi:MAG TPA: hypothetical protein VF193_03385 [Steroidobacter sp.]
MLTSLNRPDLVNKGGNETIFIPLQPDGPLCVEGSPNNFMVLTRATPDGATIGRSSLRAFARSWFQETESITAFGTRHSRYVTSSSRAAAVRD